MEHEPLSRDYVLAELRAASVRAAMYKNEIDVIGIALKAGMITAEEAIEALAESHCLGFLHPPHIEIESTQLIPVNEATAAATSLPG